MRNNPVNLVDPTGECAGDDSMGCIDRYKQDVKEAIESEDFLLNITGRIGQQLIDKGEQFVDALKGKKEAVVDTGVDVITISPIGKGFKLLSTISKEIKELEKGIKSLLTGNRGINVHLDKIKNPLKYLNDPIKRAQFLNDAKYREGLINKWKNEIIAKKNEIKKKQDQIKELISNSKNYE